MDAQHKDLKADSLAQAVIRNPGTERKGSHAVSLGARDDGQDLAWTSSLGDAYENGQQMYSMQFS